MRATILLALVALLLPRLAQAGPYSDGLAARKRKDWPTCARLFEEAARGPLGGMESAWRYQSAARCAALSGNGDDAFRLLGLAAERGLHDAKRLTDDGDLAALRDDPRWAGTVDAWKRKEQELLKSIRDPALRGEILALAEEDQAARLGVMPPNKPTPEDFARLTAADERSTARMTQIVKAHGWPGKSLVGDDGSRRAWLLVQHADRDVAFQKECLALLEKAVKSGEADGINLAYLADRVAVAEGRKQVYGTQFDDDNEPSPIEDEAHVDERRNAIGLAPLAEYRKEVQDLYGTPDEIRVNRVKWFVEHYAARWDEKGRDSVVAMTAPDPDGVFITAESPRIWVGFPTMMPAVEGAFQAFDSRKSTVRDLRVQLLAGGKVAVATFLIDTEGQYQGKPFATSGMRMTYVLEDRSRRWMLVSAHGSLPLAEAGRSARTPGPDAVPAPLDQGPGGAPAAVGER
jgi:ketosteroid isomerase-like protein